MIDPMIHAISKLNAVLEEGKKVPLSNQSIINRTDAMDALRSIEDSLPTAVEEAHAILERKEQIKEEANNHYNNTIAEAETKARALGLESNQRAEKLINDAQAEADHLYADAERQAHELIANAERKAKELVAQTAIMAEAEQEASRIRAEAQAQAKRDRIAAQEHCDELLKHAEDTAIAIANELRDARSRYGRER